MIVGLLGVIYMDQILEGLTLAKAIILLIAILAVYLVVMIVYWLGKWNDFYQKKHK